MTPPGDGADADPDAREGDLPVVDPPGGGDPPGAVHGVLLAAGTSTRFGAENKLLAAEGGEPIVRRAARALVDSAVERVTVVTGYEAGRVREALADLDVRFVRAPDYAEGQSRSVRRGIGAVREADPDAAAAVIALGDMPDVAPETVDRLLAAYAAGAGSALAAAYRGERGNPVLFDAEHFDALTDVAGDRGGRRILLTSGDAALVETGDPGVRRDVDRPGDLDGA